MAGNEEWRKNADTHKMSTEEVKRAGVEASQRRHPGEVLHQRRSLPYRPLFITLAGSALAGGVWYFTLYAKKKPDATALDVAKVASGVAQPEDTKPARR